MKRYLIVAAGCLLVGGIAGRAATPTEVVYEEVEVPVERIIEREPDTIIRWRDRIVYRNLEPKIEATAVGGGAAEVEAFCRPVVLTQTDTVVVEAEPKLLLRSVTTDPGWFWNKDRILFTGVTNLGDLKAIDYESRPGWRARTVGDSILFREPRWGWFKQGLEILAPAAAMWGVCRTFGC